MLRVMLFGAVLFLGMGTFSYGQEPLPTAEEVLADATKALGGAEKLKAIKSVRQTGKMTFSGADITGESETIKVAGGKGFSKMKLQGQEMQRGTDGKQAWSKSPRGTNALSGMEGLLARYQNTIAPTLDYPAIFGEVRCVAKKKMEGEECFVLECGKGDTIMKHNFSTKTHLLHAIEFTMESPMGEMDMVVEFKDYREVDGVQFPHKTIVHVDAGDQESVVESIELDKPFDEALFTAPK